MPIITKSLGLSGSVGKQGPKGPIGFLGANEPGTMGTIGFQGYQGFPPDVFNIQNTLYVDGTYGYDIGKAQNLASPFNTIQSAIDAANQNDFIYIHRGIYNENLTITKSLTLNFNASTLTSSSGITITISGSDTTVRIMGFPTISTNSGTCIYISGGAALFGKFKDLSTTFTTGAPQNIINNSASTVNCEARDITWNGVGSLDTQTGVLRRNNGGIITLRSRDYSILGTGDRLLLTRSSGNGNKASLYCRDINNTGSSYLVAFRGSSNKVERIFCRDVTVGYIIHFGTFPGTLDMFARNLTISNNAFVIFQIINIKLLARSITTPSLINFTSGGVQSGGKYFFTFDQIVTTGTDFLYSKLDDRDVTIFSRLYVLGNGTQNIKTRTNLNYDITKVTSNSNADNQSRFRFGSNITGQLNIFKIEYIQMSFEGNIDQLLFKVDHLLTNRTTQEAIAAITGNNNIYWIGHIVNSINRISTTTLESRQEATINIESPGEYYFYIDKLNNNNNSTNGGFTFYITGSDSTNVHFYNTRFKSRTLGIGMEETRPSLNDLNGSARLFMHGSNTIIGGETGNFVTDSVSIVTIDPSNSNKSVLINEGRLNMVSYTESSNPKGIPVKEPINGPEGAKSISNLYYTISSLMHIYRDAIIGDGPLGYYEFNEAGGSSTISDSSGNSRNLTVTGSFVSQIGPYSLGTAFSNGGSAYCDYGSTWTSGSAISIEFFLYVGTQGPTVNYDDIVTVRNGGSNILTILYSYGSLAFFDTVVPAYGGQTTTIGVWEHWVWIHTPTSYVTYKNGVRIGTGSKTRTINYVNHSIFKPSGSIYGGVPQSDTYIDEVAIYDYVLSEDQIIKHYLSAIQ